MPQGCEVASCPIAARKIITIYLTYVIVINSSVDQNYWDADFRNFNCLMRGDSKGKHQYTFDLAHQNIIDYRIEIAPGFGKKEKEVIAFCLQKTRSLLKDNRIKWIF